MSAPALARYIQGQAVVSADNLNTFEQTTNLVTDLRTFIGLPGIQVSCRGLTTVNDGGGGEFYWDVTGSGDDGINIIVPVGAASGAWVRLTTGITFGNIIVVSVVASLRAGRFSTTSIIYLTGWHVPGDGGEGFFINGPSKTDNGGTVFNDAGGLSFYRQINNCDVSSAWWGCDRTGLTDPTTALQAAINWCWSAMDSPGTNPWDGRTYAIPFLVIEPGLYAIQNTLTLPTGLAIRGRYNPCMTVNSTRLMMNSTGVTPTGVWAASIVYTINQARQPTVANGYYYTVTTGGTSSSTQPMWPTSIGATINDGSVQWTCTAAIQAGDNRDKPIFTFSRKTFNGNILLQQFVTVSIQWLEFWYVLPGGTVLAPIAQPIGLGNYPNGGSILFALDTGDTRIIACSFQHAAAQIRINILTGTGPDGFNNLGECGIFCSQSEFDSTTSAQINATGYFIGINLDLCEFFGGTSYSNTTNGGNIVVRNGTLGGGNTSPIGGWVCPMPLDTFQFQNNFCTRSNSPEILSITSTRVATITDNNLVGATNQNDFALYLCGGGSISGNTIDNSGYNASPQTDPSLCVAAIRLDGCSDVLVQGNSIINTLAGGTFNAYGILAISVSGTSTDNVVVSNSVLADYDGTPYTGAPGGSNNWINIQAGDHRSTNWNNGSFS